MRSVFKMQIYYVLIILVNILIVRSTNVERPKRDLAFIKKTIASLFGYNTNTAMISNINIPYPVPNYRVLMNDIPNAYMNQNIYRGSLSKILIPGNMVMQPVFYYARPNVPYIMAYGERNYKTPYNSFESSQVSGNMQRVIPVPSYNTVEAPLARCNNEIPVTYRKDIAKNKISEESSISMKNKSSKSSELQSFREKEDKSKESIVQRVTSSQSPQPEKIVIISTTTTQVPKKKNQLLRTSTTPTTTVEVRNKLSSFYAPTTLTKEQISTSTPPTFSKDQELTTYAITTGPTLTTLPPSAPLIKDVQEMEILELPNENGDEKIKSTSTTTAPTSPDHYKHQHKKDEINNNFIPYNASEKIVTVKYPNVSESQGDLTAQPSMVNNLIDILNSIAPIRGKVLNPLNVFTPKDTDDTLEEIDSDYMEINNQSTDVYPSEIEELNYLNKPPIIIDESSLGSLTEEGSQNKLNENEEGFGRMMPSVFATEISRGDISDV